MHVEATQFRQVMARFPTGVTVVTVGTQAREPLGFTATAFCSVSLTPPLVLLCVQKGKRGHAALSDAVAFGINVLAADQEALARRFADPRIEARFAGVDTHPGVLGVPILAGTVASIECDTAGEYEAGDHSIFLGRVIDLRHTEALPLVYFAGRFAEFDDESAQASQHRTDWLVGSPW